MSGIHELISIFDASGDQKIDGILHDVAWRNDGITYSLPGAKKSYGHGYGGGETAGFIPATQQMGDTLARYLNTASGNAADDGFAVEGFTALDVAPGAAARASIRIAQTRSDPYDYGTAWGYYPSTFAVSGDAWFYTGNFDYTRPVPGNYANFTLLHELGHTLGLAHGHSNSAFGQLPETVDMMEYTVMTYRSHDGADTEHYSNASTSYAQSFMMQDIAALQYFYGADFDTNSGDSVYSWRPGSGQTFVNGSPAFATAGNRIFATIWDGGGDDTYDLSAYDVNLTLDLLPGGHSAFGSAQLAQLGYEEFARGNIFNARLYEDDPRSLIENAIGGSGADRIKGNRADNRLEGGTGADVLYGRRGDDAMFGQAGHDRLHGGRHRDQLSGGAGDDWLGGGRGHDILRGGTGDDRLFGRMGNDILYGGEGDDLIVGGHGQDILTGGPGHDVFLFHGAVASRTRDASDRIRDFEPGCDRIDLSGFAADPLVFAGSGAFQTGTPSVIHVPAPRQTDVRVDADGDSIPDFQLILTGMFDLRAADFVL